MQKHCVVDTNVAMAADGKSSYGADCARACLEAIRDITERGVLLVIDDAWRIITEYRAVLSQGGQPGVAQTFLKWVLTNHQNPRRCACVSITPKDSDPEDFLEFPSHPGLSSFDPSDRKFVAVAATHPRHPPILQGTDTKWWGWRDTLKKCRITVRFLCADEIRDRYEGKFEG